jgi:hypothetical protein
MYRFWIKLQTGPTSGEDNHAGCILRNYTTYNKINKYINHN